MTNWDSWNFLVPLFSFLQCSVWKFSVQEFCFTENTFAETWYNFLACFEHLFQRKDRYLIYLFQWSKRGCCTGQRGGSQRWSKKEQREQAAGDQDDPRGHRCFCRLLVTPSTCLGPGQVRGLRHHVHSTSYIQGKHLPHINQSIKRASHKSVMWLKVIKFAFSSFQRPKRPQSE